MVVVHVGCGGVGRVCSGVQVDSEFLGLLLGVVGWKGPAVDDIFGVVFDSGLGRWADDDMLDLGSGSVSGLGSFFGSDCAACEL